MAVGDGLREKRRWRDRKEDVDINERVRWDRDIGRRRRWKNWECE